jgi:predicted small metal-binding protein
MGRERSIKCGHCDFTTASTDKKKLAEQLVNHLRLEHPEQSSTQTLEYVARQMHKYFGLYGPYCITWTVPTKLDLNEIVSNRPSQ